MVSKSFLLLISLFPFFLFSQETISVTVTGEGESIETARSNAIQKAVRKALGEIVDSETITKNGELIKDEVISYSDGFVSKTVDVSGPVKDPIMGYFEITLQAELIRSKVVKRLKDINIKVVEIDGNSLSAQALSKMEKAESGKQLLAKALNEDFDPAKLIKCDLVHLDANGELVRGSFGPDSIRVLEDQQIELTTLWEVTMDIEAYYKQTLPRLGQAINQVSKRKVASNLKRQMYQSYKNKPTDQTFHSFPTMKTVFYSGRYKDKSCLIHEKGNGIYLGDSRRNIHYSNWGKVVDYTNEGKSSTWRISTPEQEFFVALELRSNHDRSVSDFEVHVLDFETYNKIFADSTSRVLPNFLITAKNKDDEIITQQKITEPTYLIGNSKDKETLKFHPLLHNDTLIENIIDPQKLTFVGPCKSYNLRSGALSFTISPEFVFSREGYHENFHDWYDDREHMVSNSVVMEVIHHLSMEEIKQIKSLTMQPIPTKSWN